MVIIPRSGFIILSKAPISPTFETPASETSNQIETVEKSSTEATETEGNTGKEILRNIDGKDVLVPYENYKNDITTSLIDKIKNLDNLRNIWISPEQRKVLLENLPEGPSSILLLQELEKLKDCDLFDVLSNLTFSVRPITLIERSDSFVYKNDKWIKKFPNNAQKIILSISNQFSKGGIEELETPNLFDDKDIKKNGGIDYLLENKIDPKGLLIDTKYKILL